MKKAREKEKVEKSRKKSRKKAAKKAFAESSLKALPESSSRAVCGEKKREKKPNPNPREKISGRGAGEVKHEKTYSVLTGIFAGLINGVFGGGGGMIVVPMLVYLLKKQPRVAHATAILLILPMSITSGLFYAAFGSFRIEAGIPVTIGVVAGGVLGALLLGKMSSKFIVALFSVVMAAAGVKMLFF